MNLNRSKTFKITLLLIFILTIYFFIYQHILYADINEIIPETSVTKPIQNKTFTDPVLKTSVTRITDAKKMGYSGIVPDYSKRQAWNCDETLFILKTCDGKTLLFDAKTNNFIKELQGVEGEDIFWHPTNSNFIYFNPDNTLYLFNIKNNTKEIVYKFNDFDFANTRAEGNLSNDGRFYAVAGQNYDQKTSVVTFKELQLLDIYSGKIISKLKFPVKIENFDWVSVSPKGNFIIVDYADDISSRFHGVEVYDRNFNFLWQKSLGAGHSDLGIDDNGDEVLIMDIYDPERNKTIIKKFSLKDGSATELLEVSQFFDLHISCRNIFKPGWCFISTFDYVERLTHSNESWLPFEDEIFALKLDGSGKTIRLAHHYSRRYSPETPDSDTSVYFAEPHATVNRYGTKILFGSNWNTNIKDESGLDTYLMEFNF